MVLEVRHHMRISDDQSRSYACDSQRRQPMMALAQLHRKCPDIFLIAKEVLGRLFHVTSRDAGDLLSSVGGRDDCWLSGNPPPVVCARPIDRRTRDADEKDKGKITIVIDAWLIDFLDAVLWCGYATGLDPHFRGLGCGFTAVTTVILPSPVK